MDLYEIIYKGTVRSVTVLYHGYKMYVVDIQTFIHLSSHSLSVMECGLQQRIEWLIYLNEEQIAC